MAKDNFDQAIEVYKRCISRCDRVLENENYNMQAHEDRREAVSGIVEIAFRYILDRADEKAVDACKYALSIRPDLPIANLRLAHVRMLSGDRDEARPIYHRYRTVKSGPQSTYAETILQDLKEMREHKLSIGTEAAPPAGRLATY